MSDGWMENYPLADVRRIAAGGEGIIAEGIPVAVAELERRGYANVEQLTLDTDTES